MNIPGYQLGREVKTGEFCSVYSALELESSKTVTIKFFQQQLSSNPEFCQYIKETSDLLVNKTIGNIIPLKQAVWNHEGCYLITDYFPCSQNQQPLQTKFTIEEVLNFGQQLANSLSQLHRMGLVHGGVSTSNLLFPNLSQVTLGPYAFQRTFKTDTLTSSTPVPLEEAWYMAPEYSTGLDARSDFYSLGVVLYELLFKVKPFTAEDQQQLQVKKENMQFEIPASAEKLTPLFNKLLASNPDNRISNAEEFTKIVGQCGFTNENTDSPNLENDSNKVVTAKNKKPTNQNKNILIYSAIAGALMIAILTYVTISNPPVEPYKGSIKQTAKTTEQPIAIQQESVSAIKKTDNEDIANSLYEKSRQQILQNNYGAALMSINNALKEMPGHEGAKKLKQEIEFEFEVRAYLSRAEKLINQKKLTQPENDNALATYTKLATLLPPGDTRAKEGLQKIANRYYQLANNLVLKKQFEPAKKYITTGLTVIPDYPNLKQLEFYINQEEIKQQQLKADRINQQKQLLLQQQQQAEREQQRQQQILQKNKLATLQKEQALKTRRQQERERALQAQQKRQQIENRISTIRNLLRANQLSRQSLNRALEVHSELTTLTQQDARIPQLFQQIIDSYAVIARNQKNIPDFTEALETIDQGLALDRKNKQLLRLKDEINTSISKAEAKKKQVPIIGTF